MSYTTASQRQLIEMRERQRRLLRFAPDRYIDTVELVAKAKPRSSRDCELKLRAIAEEQLEGELEKYLEDRGAHMTASDTRTVVNYAGTGAGLGYVLEAVGVLDSTAIESPPPNAGKLLTFTAAASIADLLAEDVQRDGS